MKVIVVPKINPILCQSQIDKFPQVQQDYEDVKKRVDKDSILPSIFDIFPTFRRIEKVPDKMSTSDWIPATGLVALAVLNGPEDLRDMKSAYNQIKSSMTGKTFNKPYDYKIAQHPFSFFKGTLLHKFVNPATSPCPKLAKWLLKNDTTLMDTKFGGWVTKEFNIEENHINTKIKNITHTEKRPNFVKAKSFKTTPFGDLTARALTRTTKIGAIVLAGLETAHLTKEIANGENIFKSTAKSATNITGSLAGIGYGGAIGAKYFGAAGSLVGMGLGAIASNKIIQLLD